MKTENLNFFERLQQTNCDTIQFTVVFDFENQTTTLSIIPKTNLNDDSISELKPIILNGPTAEFSNDAIFETIQKPLQELAQDFSNLKQYLAQKQESEKKSQIQKDLKNKYNTNKTTLEKLTNQGAENFPKNEKQIKKLIALVKEYKPNCNSVKSAEILIANCSQNSLF